MDVHVCKSVLIACVCYVQAYERSRKQIYVYTEKHIGWGALWIGINKYMRLHRPPRNPHNTAARIGQTPDDRKETKAHCCDSTAVFPCLYMPTEAWFLSWAMETIPCFGSAIEELMFEMRKSVPTEVWHGVFGIKYEWDKSRWYNIQIWLWNVNPRPAVSGNTLYSSTVSLWK